MLTFARSLFRFHIRPFSTDPERESKARLEIDPYDNIAMDVENNRSNPEEAIYQDPWPRRKLKELYLITLERLKGMPEDFGYRVFTEEITRFRLKVVENQLDLGVIEDRIGYGTVDDLIFEARNEIKLIDIFTLEKAWEPEEFTDTSYKVLDNLAYAAKGDYSFIFTQEKPTRKDK